MTHAEQGAALLRAILDAPDDDAARLVYADWLDENGQDGDPRFLSYPDFIRGYVSWEAAGYAGGHPFARRHRQLNNLMNAPRHGFGLVDRVHPQVPPDDMAYVLWRRGFVESVRCTLDAWREHGPAVVAAHPVTRVECSDKEPYVLMNSQPGVARCCWGSDAWEREAYHERAVIPHHVWLEVAERADWQDELQAAGATAAGWSLHDDTGRGRDALSAVLLAMAKREGAPC